MIKIDTSGLDELQKKLEDIDGTHEVSSDDLMTDEFIQENTNFSNWKELMEAGGIQSSEDIQAEPFSLFIAENTEFDGFDDLAQAAAAEYMKKKLGF